MFHFTTFLSACVSHMPDGCSHVKSSPYRSQYRYSHPPSSILHPPSSIPSKPAPRIDVSQGLPAHGCPPRRDLKSGLADLRPTVAPPVAFVFPSRFVSISHLSEHRGFWASLDVCKEEPPRPQTDERIMSFKRMCTVLFLLSNLLERFLH
jgi:hypothetical protein